MIRKSFTVNILEKDACWTHRNGGLSPYLICFFSARYHTEETVLEMFSKGVCKQKMRAAGA